MSSAEETLYNIRSAIASIDSSIGAQSSINQATEQRLDAVDQRFDAIDQRFTNVETSFKEILNFFKSQTTQNPSRPSDNHPSVSPEAQPPRPASKSDGPQTKPSWASIASKPPAPLTDRKRQALHRAFNPPVHDPTQNGSYTFVYLPRSRRMNRAQIRSKFRQISIDNLRILDLSFPARNTIGVLLHEAYLPEFKSKLLEIDSHLIQDFDPLDHHHIADPKYQSFSEERRTQLAKALHQDRCIRSLYFIRLHLVPGVAKYFVHEGWVPSHVAEDIINQRLPRPVKRRPAPQSVSESTSQNPQLSGLSTQTNSSRGSAPQVPLPTNPHDLFGNPVPTQDMGTTPDFASNAYSSESSRPSSPVSDAGDLSQ
ncbi:uncharacterized protein ATC70_000259 [Mucor velutinosus]|uniref:Uncharacterized protein n=1 Tax=Mucor velutinosus TaxID=708070 RepID=A0AAN7DGA1_9FUNG|nr:hypothetical protein ATC70_000259 [Mucor velutinosus]